jgi:tetratricopeptide (TPR) repeat protein
MDEWHVGDPADWGDSVGVPDLPYMGYLDDDDEEEKRKRPSRHVRKEQSLEDRAWHMRITGQLDTAMILVNIAIEKNPDSPRAYNIKAIILEDMCEYDEALEYYDKAIALGGHQIVKDNKARLLETISRCCRLNDPERSLALINDALKITGDESDRLDFFATKRDILEVMGRHREAYVLNKLANRQPELVDEFESQSRLIKDTKDTLIVIAGTSFYDHDFAEGLMMDLIRETDNGHDPDAIRVEVQAKTVGYVANSPNTLIDEAKSATEIKDMFEERAKAKFLFTFMERYPIAKLVIR